MTSEEDHIVEAFNDDALPESETGSGPDSEPPPPEMPSEDVQRRDDADVRAEIDIIIQDAEDMRVRRMKDRRMRGFVSMTFGLIAICAGAAAFGWFFLMEANLLFAMLSMGCALVLPYVLSLWSEGPIKAYEEEYKRVYMPRLARAIGGLKFHPDKGISSRLLAKTGLLPPHKSYQAEDCFLGRYKGVKVIMSEARLYKEPKGGEMVFDGIFTLLEVPEKAFPGHTIISADEHLVAQHAKGRWQKLQPVQAVREYDRGKRFHVFSSVPDKAPDFITEKLLKELAEAADIFDKAALSAVLFGGKYIFIMIPTPLDMFEASNIHIPITSREHALKVKQEIEKILEIIDVFDIYGAKASS